MTTIDELVAERREISWMLFEHVRPLVELYLNPSIKAPKARKYQINNNTETTIANEIKAIIEESLPAWYSCQELFFERINPNHDHGIKKALCRTREDFYREYRTLAHRVLNKNGRGLTPEAKDVLKRTLDFNVLKAGLDLNKKHHLMIVYGSPIITPDPRYPIVLQVSRIKNLKCFAEKFARYICEGILEFEALTEELKKQENPRIADYKVREAIAYMHQFGLITPFDINDNGNFNQIEYLLMRSWIRDMLGVTCVTRKREEATTLVGEVISARRTQKYNPNRIEVATGYTLIHYQNQWRFAEDNLVDNRIKRGSRVLGSDGNKNIFLYATTPNINHVVEMGFYSIGDYAEDRIGGKGSHLSYEAKKQAKIRTWPRLLQELCYSIAVNAENIMRHVDIYQIPFNRRALQNK